MSRNSAQGAGASRTCSASSSGAAAAGNHSRDRRRAPISNTLSMSISGRRSAARRCAFDQPPGSMPGLRRHGLDRPQPHQCPECNGSGSCFADSRRDAVQYDLPAVRGKRRVEERLPELPRRWTGVSQDTVEVRIPAGVASGSRLRVPGKGNAGTMGAPAGDLYITIRVDPHQFFERDGDDIKTRIPISVWEASLGAKIDVPTIDGKSCSKFLRALTTARNSGCGKKA